MAAAAIGHTSASKAAYFAASKVSYTPSRLSGPDADDAKITCCGGVDITPSLDKLAHRTQLT